MSAKPLRMWALYEPFNGGLALMFETVRPTRTRAINSYRQFFVPGMGWKYWYRLGYRCKRVLITPEATP